MAKKKGTSAPSDYNAAQITVLQGLEAVRKRPAMYIGDTSERGLHHLVYEVVDNAIDEAMAGECDTITVTLHDDGSCEVVDNGRGIPVDIHLEEGISGVELVLARLHAGGKFDNKAYKVSGGLHGVGVSCVNALSEWLHAKVYRDGQTHEMEFHIGEPDGPLKITGKSAERGSSIRFLPDRAIFKEGTRFTRRILRRRLRELAYLNRGLRLRFVDGRPDEDEKLDETFKFDGGIVEYVQEIVKDDRILLTEPFYCHAVTDTSAGEVEVEASFQYYIQKRGEILSFVNNIRTMEGGTHVDGFKMAMTGSIKKYMKDYGLDDKDVVVDGEAVRYGLLSILTIRLHEPQFEGQTKGKLGTTAAKGAVQGAIWSGLYSWLEKNPTEARKIVTLVVSIARANQRAKKAFDLERKKDALGGGILPGKLTDCISRDASRTELFLVEGDSAGGNTKQGREPEFQAVLPLRGKILNVEKVNSEAKLLGNEEIKALIQAVGIGVSPRSEFLTEEKWLEQFPDEETQGLARELGTYPISEANAVTRAGMALEKIRYSKIIIMTDADVDGAHIRTLLLTFIYRHLRPLIEDGHVYVAKPPLYKVRAGKEERYVADDRAKEALVDEWEDRSPVVQRFKGLGEMDAIELWETTMNPATRVLERVQITDAREAEETFVTLMGKEVGPRKRFIEQNANRVMNLDI